MAGGYMGVIETRVVGVQVTDSPASLGGVSTRHALTSSHEVGENNA